MLRRIAACASFEAIRSLFSVILLLHTSVCIPSVQSDGFLKDNNNAAQRLLDGVKYISQSVSELSVKPAKAVTSWLTDQIAPTYWKPNSLILVGSYKINSTGYVGTYGTDLHIYRWYQKPTASAHFFFFFFVICARIVTNVGRSFSPTTPSTTAVPVERVSATLVPPKPGRSRRGVGGSRQSGSAMRVFTTEEFQQVKTINPSASGF